VTWLGRRRLAATLTRPEAYVSAVNDNFEWVDGQLRDRIDDTKSMSAWQSHLRLLQARFDRRLKEIATRINSTALGIGIWGDKPAHWDRL
jgi:hypothetical protein